MEQAEQQERGEADLEAYLAEVELVPFTPSTVTDPQALREEIAAIRESGIAMTHSEYTPGIRGLGVAVTLEGAVVGAFGIAIPESRFDAQLEARAREVLLRARTVLTQAA